MSLEVGARLGPCEIVELRGRGGMGDQVTSWKMLDLRGVSLCRPFRPIT